MSQISLEHEREARRRLWKRMASLVLPMALQNLFTSLVSASDALMLGGLSQSGLSAVSLATQVTFVHTLFIGGLMIGESSMAAQYWGKGDRKAVEKILGISTRYALLISLLFSLATLLLPRQLMRLFTPDEELIALGARYLRVVSPMYLMAALSQLYLCIMKNSERVARSSVYGTVPVVLNLLLNAVFIYGLLGLPKLEIAGAALATVLAKAVELALVLTENRRAEVKLRLRHLTERNPLLRREYWKYTRPVLANMIAWGGGVTMYSVLMGHLGSDAVAANSLASIVRNLIGCVASGFGTGAGILVGNELGADKLAEARADTRRILRMALIVGAVSGAVLLLASPLILRFSTTLSDTAHGYLRLMLWMCSYYMIGSSFNQTLISGIFVAGGDTRFGFWCDLINIWGFIRPVALLAMTVFHAPVPVVFFILTMDEIIKIPVEVHHYHKYKWVRNITRENV